MSIETADAFMSIFGLTRQACETCKQSRPAIPYPMLVCNLRAEYMDKNSHCCRWEKKK